MDRIRIKDMIPRNIPSWILLCLAGYAVTCTISITLCEIFFTAALLFWVADAVMNKKNIRRELSFYLAVPIAVFSVIHILAAAAGIDPGNSLKDARKIYLILMFFLAANYLGDESNIKKITVAFAAGCAFTGVYAVITAIRKRYIGGDINFRAMSFSGNHMHLGGMMMMAVIMLSALFIYLIREKRDKRVLTVFIGLSLAISAVALAFTYTRSSWLAAAAGILLLTFVLDKRIFFAVLIMMLCCTFFLKDTSLGKRTAEISEKTLLNTGAERLRMWKSGLNIIKDHPLHGVGTANIGKIYPAYRDKNAFESNQAHLHNNIIQIAAIDGIFGAAAVMWIFIASWSAMAEAIKLTSGFSRYMLLSVLSLNVGFFINGIFEYNLFSSQVALIFWFFMGISAALIKNRAQASNAGKTERKNGDISMKRK